MVHKILLWSGLGVAVRFWQLGLEMRPFFTRQSLWVYPVYGGIGGSFGYWLMGVEQRQMSYLQERRDKLLEKRKRRVAALSARGIDPETEGLGLTKEEIQGDPGNMLLNVKVPAMEDVQEEGMAEVEATSNGNGKAEAAEA